MDLFWAVLQADIPTVIGVGPGEDGVAMETDKDHSPKRPEKYYIDSTFIHRPREGVEMKHPLKDGLSEGNLVIKLCVEICMSPFSC